MVLAVVTSLPGLASALAADFYGGAQQAYFHAPIRFEAYTNGLGQGAPDGTITFRLNGARVCIDVPLQPLGAGGNQQQAYCELPKDSTPTSFELAADYSGNAIFAPQTKVSTVTLQPLPITLTHTASPAIAIPGMPVTFTATVSTPIAGGTVPGGGRVNFAGFTGEGFIAEVVPVNGVATLTYTYDSTGVKQMRAFYLGGGEWNNDAIFASVDVRSHLPVLAPINAYFIFNPGLYGNPVFFVFDLSFAPGYNNPTGTLTLRIDGQVQCVRTIGVPDGSNNCFTNFPVRGTHVYTVHYSGDQDYAETDYGPYPIYIAGGATIPSLVATPNPANAGETVTLVADVNNGLYTIEGGTITFTSDGSPIAGCIDMPLQSVALQCVATFTAGTHQVAFNYSGAPTEEPATASLSLVVNGPPAAPARKVDFNADGKADLLWRNVNGSVAIWLMDGFTQAGSAQIFPAGTAWQVGHMVDFNGDGKTDLLWLNPDGRVTMYLMDGTTAVTKANLLPAGGGWTVTHAPDLNGDGKADLIFQNADGTIAAWLMDGTTMTSGTSLLGAGSGWSVTRTGDFDGDGKADLLWTHTDGRVAIWLMDGLAIKSTNQILNAGTGWSVTHTADFNGDGKSDLVWQNVDGSIAIWLMNGTAMASGSGLLGAGTGWHVTKTGDFNGDGKADLFFLHDDGRVAIYLMNGLVPTQTTQILNAGGGWSAKRIQDMNGDGKADIVWENVDGTVAVWLMNGTTMTSGSGILGAGSGWSVSGVSP
ncbi:hypothetical protein BWI17_21120 [Betaproteobacteria bacterium GR16-43]|nr:hypothetical protein BWI17_21120 [Betaproteobacteria bacterium GR16-43]